ncbi:MAG: CinA family protein [Acidimicrobiales bacterium]
MSDAGAGRGGTADDGRRRIVAAIHDAEPRLVLAIAGGGNAAITDLLDVPGASRTVLEVVVPYAEPALIDLLIDRPGASMPDLATTGAVSQQTVEDMAASCLHRARRLAHRLDLESNQLLGVACTAALVSDRPKRGAHRAHIAVARADGIAHRRVDLKKGQLDRAGEDRVVADAVLGVIADACGLALQT